MKSPIEYTVLIDTGSGVDEIDLHPEDDWETLTEYQNYLMWMADNPQAWATFQSVGPEMSVPVSRIISIKRMIK